MQLLFLQIGLSKDDMIFNIPHNLATQEHMIIDYFLKFVQTKLHNYRVFPNFGTAGRYTVTTKYFLKSNTARIYHYWVFPKI